MTLYRINSDFIVNSINGNIPFAIKYFICTQLSVTLLITRMHLNDLWINKYTDIKALIICMGG